MSLLVPAYPGCPGSKAVKRSLLLAKFEDLVSLFIADHVKSTLPSDCLKYVLSVKNSTDVGWLQHRRLAEVIDTNIASHSSDLSQAGISHVVNTNRHNRVMAPQQHAQHVSQN